MAPKKQVSPAIRILRGERDASARATHLEAANGKFLLTTNERKQMSSKTNFKRIALVAVAAVVESDFALVDVPVTIASVGSVKNVACDGTELRTPRPKAATATSAMRLKFVFVDICFLSLVVTRNFLVAASR